MKEQTTRAKFIALCVVAAAAALHAPIAAAQADKYPERPIRLIAPFAAGASTDAAARHSRLP